MSYIYFLPLSISHSKSYTYAQSGCPDVSSTTKSDAPAIRQLVTTDDGWGIDASLSLANDLGTRATGVPVAENVTVDTNGARTTYVVGLTTDSSPGSYGAGQVGAFFYEGCSFLNGNTVDID